MKRRDSPPRNLRTRLKSGTELLFDPLWNPPLKAELFRLIFTPLLCPSPKPAPAGLHQFLQGTNLRSIITFSSLNLSSSELTKSLVQHPTHIWNSLCPFHLQGKLVRGYPARACLNRPARQRWNRGGSRERRRAAEKQPAETTCSRLGKGQARGAAERATPRGQWGEVVPRQSGQ